MLLFIIIVFSPRYQFLFLGLRFLFFLGLVSIVNEIIFIRLCFRFLFPTLSFLLWFFLFVALRIRNSFNDIGAKVESRSSIDSSFPARSRTCQGFKRRLKRNEEEKALTSRTQSTFDCLDFLHLLLKLQRDSPRRVRGPSLCKRESEARVNQQFAKPRAIPARGLTDNDRGSLCYFTNFFISLNHLLDASLI